jgi:hypothetical protein
MGSGSVTTSALSAATPSWPQLIAGRKPQLLVGQFVGVVFS